MSTARLVKTPETDIHTPTVLAAECPWCGSTAKLEATFDGRTKFEDETACPSCDRAICWAGTVQVTVEVDHDVQVRRGTCHDDWHSRDHSGVSFTRCPSCEKVHEDKLTMDLFPPS